MRDEFKLFGHGCKSKWFWRKGHECAVEVVADSTRALAEYFHLLRLPESDSRWARCSSSCYLLRFWR